MSWGSMPLNSCMRFIPSGGLSSLARFHWQASSVDRVWGP